MEYHRIGYFVVPVDEQEELAALDARWRASLGHDRIELVQVLANNLYRYAQDRAVSQWHHWHPLAYQADIKILSYLWRKCEDFDNTTYISSEDCPRVARAVDELAARRGGQDALIKHITKLTLGKIPQAMIREVYIAFRTALATAVELNAALVCTDYEPGAERELAAEQAREAARRAEPVPELTPAEREAQEIWWREVQEYKPDNSQAPAWALAGTHYDLYMVPEPYISDIMALYRQYRVLSDEDPYESLDECMSLRDKAELIGGEEWARWLKLQSLGQTTTWEYLETTLGAFRPGSVLGGALALDPARVRALYAALSDWQAHVGGRDAAVAHLLEKSHGHHLGITEATYDAVFALYQYGAEHGCGFITSCDAL